MKKVAPKMIILLIAIIVIVVIAATTFAIAYWSGSPEQAIEGVNAVDVDNSEKAIRKYLVYKPIGDFATDYCFEYNDANGWTLKYEYGSDYIFEGGAHKAGARNAVATAEANSVASSIANVAVIGYFGTLGEHEELDIPSTIKWGNTTLNVIKIAIKTPEYEDAMNLITDVIIPSSITSIERDSFSGAGKLRYVHFDSTTLPSTISDAAFVGMRSDIVYYKKNAGGTYESVSIR